MIVALPPGTGRVLSQTVHHVHQTAVTGRIDRSGIDLDGLSVVPHLAARLLGSSSRTAPEVTRHAG